MKNVAIGCAVAAVIGLIVLVFGSWLLLFREMPMLSATLSLPVEVAVNETVTMTVTASNPHDRTVTLDSIDIDLTFLEGLQVIKITPEPTDTMTVFGQRCWFFEVDVDAGGSQDVQFEFRALQPGRFTGDVDVCNPNQDFITLLGDIVIKDAPPPAAQDIPE